MAPRKVEEPTQDKWDNDVHPAFGMLGAGRVQTSPPGAVLFDSDIKHQNTVIIRLKRAYRKRELNRDWIGGGEELFEVEMSEAQWASFVSSMNTGDGVACTIRATPKDYLTPGLPYDPRLAHSMREVHEAGSRTFDAIKQAFDKYSAHRTTDNLRTLRFTIENATSNLNFAAKMLGEHAENVVQKARADIEAIVLGKAKQLGIEANTIGDMLEIESAPDDTA